MTRVHIVLRKDVTSTMVDQLIQKGEIINVNHERAIKFGILTGEMPSENIDDIRNLYAVENVEIDSMKTSLI